MKTILSLLLTFIFLIQSEAQIVIDQSNEGVSPTKSLVDNMQSCMQTIIAGSSGLLVKVAVEIETQDCPYPIICKILDGSPTDTVLASEFIELPINSSRGFREFTFANPPLFIEGRTYTIVLMANCISGPGHSTFWYKSVTNAYSSGQAYNQSGINIQPEDKFNDFYFMTFLDVSNKLNELNKITMNFYPNPAKEELFVKINNKSANIEVINITGESIQKITADNGIFHLNTSSLPPGQYLLIARTDLGNVVKMFIKQ